MAEIKLIVVDIDGTLLNSQHEMSARNEQAIKAALAQGVQIVLATGKTRASAVDVIERLGLDTPGIYLQGLTVYNPDGTIRHEQTLDPAVARQVITYAEDRGFTMIAYSGGSILMRAVNEAGRRLTVSYHEPEPEGIGSLQNILGEMPVHKLVAIKSGEERAVNALRWQLSMQLDGKARLVQAQIPDMLEILPPGASKGKTMRTLVKEMGVGIHEVMAIGDGENDLEMIEAAGIGVAMENAAQAVKDVAQFVTLSNDADGVAHAIEKYIPGVKAEDTAGDADQDGETTRPEDRVQEGTGGDSGEEGDA